MSFLNLKLWIFFFFFDNSLNLFERDIAFGLSCRHWKQLFVHFEHFLLRNETKILLWDCKYLVWQRRHIHFLYRSFFFRELHLCVLNRNSVKGPSLNYVFSVFGRGVAQRRLTTYTLLNRKDEKGVEEGVKNCRFLDEIVYGRP